MNEKSKKKAKKCKMFFVFIFFERVVVNGTEAVFLVVCDPPMNEL